MWNKLSEQAQLGTNNAEGREQGGGSHAEPRSAQLAGHLLILNESWPTMI